MPREYVCTQMDFTCRGSAGRESLREIPCATTVVVALGQRSVVGVSGDKLVDDTGATFQDLRARPTVAAAQLN